MKINELEDRLSVTRANVRFYEKEGLLNPNRSGNGYRVYSEEDVETLQKIIIFRKLGLSIDEIRAIFNQELDLLDAVDNNLKQLQKQMDDLQGAMDVCKKMEQEQVKASDFDTQRYWDLIHSEEEKGLRFFDYVKDYVEFEKALFSNMWWVNFWWNFKDAEKKYGWKLAVMIAVGICVLRGLGTRFLWHNGSFLYGFSYPLVVFAMASIVCFPTFALNKKYAGKVSEEGAETDRSSKQPLLLRFLKGIGKLVLGIGVFLFAWIGIPVLVSEPFSVFWLGNIGDWKEATYCINYNLFVLLMVVSLTVVFSIFSLYSSKIGGFLADPYTGEPQTNRIPKGVRRRFTALYLGMYLLTMILYTSWFDLYTTDGLRVQRFLFHTEYTWEQAESFRVQESWDGTLSLIITMQDGKNFDPMNILGLVDGDMEETGLMITKQLTAGGVPCLVKDWDSLREDFQKYDYWQKYMDELRVIIDGG